jgi:sulfotransferase
MKDFYFLGGLPRSGNTLLSAILNQNPDIYVSPISPLLDNLTIIENTLNSNQVTLSSNFQDNTTSALKHFVEGFYSNVDKPIIVDRNKVWGHKQSMFTASKYITDKPKVIYTVRDIPSILVSFLLLIGNSKDNFIDNTIRELGIRPYGKQTQDDLRCDFLINNQIYEVLVSLTELLQTEIPVCLIEYDDLIKNPEIQLNKIYDFLELNSYSHDFNNIEKLEKENLENAGLPSNLHNVRNKIEKTSPLPKTILSPSSLNKYSGMEFWRKKL